MRMEMKKRNEMKLLKKIGVLLISFMLLATLAGCEKEEASVTDTTVDVATPTVEEPAETEVVEALDPDVQGIVDRGVLKVGVKNNVIGFGFQDTLSGVYSGLEITLAEMIADSLGVETEYTAVTAATRTELLDSGALDFVIATFTITDERKENWDFSTPYYTDSVTVLVENASGITTLEDLVDTKVGVSSGSTSARALVAAMIEKGIVDGTNFSKDTFDASTWTEGVAFLQFDDYPTISTALSAGEIDAFCVDRSILAAYNTESRSYIADSFAPQDYGVATKKGSGVSAFVEEHISTWLADGTVANLIAENGLE